MVVLRVGSRNESDLDAFIHQIVQGDRCRAVRCLARRQVAGAAAGRDPRCAVVLGIAEKRRRLGSRLNDLDEVPDPQGPGEGATRGDCARAPSVLRDHLGQTDSGLATILGFGAVLIVTGRADDVTIHATGVVTHQPQNLLRVVGHLGVEIRVLCTDVEAMVDAAHARHGHIRAVHGQVPGDSGVDVTGLAQVDVGLGLRESRGVVRHVALRRAVDLLRRAEPVRRIARCGRCGERQQDACQGDAQGWYFAVHVRCSAPVTRGLRCSFPAGTSGSGQGPLQRCPAGFPEDAVPGTRRPVPRWTRWSDSTRSPG